MTTAGGEKNEKYNWCKYAVRDRSLFMKRGGGEGKIYWKDQNFCKAPPPGQVISK